MRKFDTDYLNRLYAFVCNRYRLAADPSARGRWQVAIMQLDAEVEELDFTVRQCLGIQTTAR